MKKIPLIMHASADISAQLMRINVSNINICESANSASVPSLKCLI
jgi:hypothetical protein